MEVRMIEGSEIAFKEVSTTFKELLVNEPWGTEREVVERYCAEAEKFGATAVIVNRLPDNFHAVLTALSGISEAEFERLKKAALAATGDPALVPRSGCHAGSCAHRDGAYMQPEKGRIGRCCDPVSGGRDVL